jgi:hypothetical protein
MESWVQSVESCGSGGRQTWVRSLLCDLGRQSSLPEPLTSDLQNGDNSRPTEMAERMMAAHRLVGYMCLRDNSYNSVTLCPLEDSSRSLWQECSSGNLKAR